jgi:hypothetical protein
MVNEVWMEMEGRRGVRVVGQGRGEKMGRQEDVGRRETSKSN